MSVSWCRHETRRSTSGEPRASLTALDTAYAYEVLVVDGDSSDATREIAREYDATIVPEGGESIATARNLGASASVRRVAGLR